MDNFYESPPKKVSVSNLFSLIFLGLSSLGFAYAPNGFNEATTMNHIQAILTVVASINVMMKMDD